MTANDIRNIALLGHGGSGKKHGAGKGESRNGGKAGGKPGAKGRKPRP